MLLDDQLSLEDVVFALLNPTGISGRAAVIPFRVHFPSSYYSVLSDMIAQSAITGLKPAASSRAD